MKKQFNFKSIVRSKARWLLTLIAILTLGVGQMWGWTAIYLNSSFTETNWGQKTFEIVYPLGGGGDSQAHRFLPIYTSGGDVYWRFYHGNNYTISPASNNYVIGYGTKYQVKGNGDNNFETNVYAGVIAVHSHQAMTENKEVGDVNGSNDEPAVWMERPTIYIWHNWSGNTSNWGNNGSSGQKAMTDNNDGTYTYDGVYSASGTYVGIQGDGRIKKWFTEANTSKVGSPTSGDKCRFTWNSNGYKGYNGEEDNRGTLTITKLWKITYDGNGNGGGSAPDDEYVMHNTATATYTNTGSMTNTNMAFIGWNTKADGTGDHYDAGANITLTSNQTLYAEWVPCWVLRGGNSDTSDGTDAMGDWTPQEMTIIGTNAFMIELNLAASTTYQFKIVDRHNGKKADYSTWTHYGNNGTMTGTTTDWTFSTSEGNCKLSTGGDGAGTWRFAWNASSKVLCVYKKDDATKSSFAQGKYIYFDARTESDWKANPFNAKFYFKNLATGEDDGDITCNNTAKLDGWVYYALVPADKTWGAVQMNNLETVKGDFQYDANKIYARDRSNANQNCMVTPASGKSGITLSWGTYCPPMSSASIQNVGTTVTYGSGAGTSENPYIVATGSSIYTLASSTSALNDGNMAAYYQFKKEGSNDGEESTTNTHTFTASSTNETKEAMTVVARNGYNSAYGTASPASSAIYYEARTPYTMSYAKGSPAASISGSLADAIKVYNVAYPLPDGAIFTRSGYTQTGWATSDGGTKAYDFSDNYTDNSDQAFYPFWTPNTYTVRFENLDADAGHKGSIDTTVTFNDTINMKGGIEKPRKRHYVFGGYYISTNKGVSLTDTQIIDADGKWKKNVSGYTGTKDGVASWVCAADTVLYAKWTDSIYTVAVQVSPAGAGKVQVSGSEVSEVTAGYTVRSSEMTPVGASVLWKFKEWRVSSDDCVLDLAGTDYHRDFQPGTDNKMKITARATGQKLTAVFEPRYTLVGKIYDSESDGGMPGMSNYTVVFPPSDSTCTRNLLANTKYQVEIHDLARGANMGRSGCASGCVLEENTSLVMENQDNVVFLNTTGAGYYIFKITNINGSGNPTLTVLRPHQVNFGRRRKDIDNGTHDDNTGGTLSVKAGESAISSGAWVTYNDTVTYTTSVQPGYEQAWYTSSDYSSTFSAGGIWGERLRSTSNVYAQFTEQAKTVTINKTGKGTITVDAAAFTWGQTKTCGVTTTRRLVATADDGYSFSSWTVPDGVNFQLDDKESDTDYDVTLRGKASGSNGTLTANFTENKYTITVSADATGGGTVSTTEVTAGIDTKPAITATVTNEGWHFKQWNCTGGASVTSSTSATTTVSASETGTVTAIFERRYILVGSELDETESGMPGWVYNDVTAEFTETSYTTPGDGEDITVDFRCTRTLLPNRTYKFSIHDRAKGENLGDETDQIVIESGASKLCNTQDHNIRLNATGYGNYTFKITKLSDGDNYPTVTIDRPTVYQLNLGWTEGGTVSAYTRNGATPTNYPIVNGQYVSDGDSIVFAAVPAAGYSFEGWHSSDAYNSQFATDPNMHIRNINATVNAYAKFVPVALTFTNNGGSGDGKWNTASNWSPACVPTLGHDVTIQAPVVVAADHATAKSIVLDQNSHTGKLTIEANKGLEVVGTITRTTDGSNRLATREEDLVLESSSAGNASLIFDNSNSDAATVMMYSKASISGSTWNWQYVGTPFTGSIPLYNYYGSWMYKWNNGWDVVHGGDELDPFAGYCLTQNSATTHVMGGTLVSTTDDVEVTMAASTDMVLANSWTAPISIASFDIEGDDATFTSTPATVYLFNTGMAENGSNEGTEAGTYISVPINSAPYTGNGLIAPMQGFFVTTNGGSSGTITMNYGALVRPAGSHTEIVAGPMKVRKQEETKPDVMKIRANGSKYSDRVVILAREDFSEGFDNGWDGEKLSFGAEAPSVYVINEQGGYDAVSAIPDLEGTVVGFRAGTNNSCTMTFEYDGEEIWYLNDLQTQQSTLIDSELTYTFSSSSYDNEARFIISATPIRKITTGNESVGAEAAKVRKLIINDKLYIIRGGRMYSADGAMIK